MITRRGFFKKVGLGALALVGLKLGLEVLPESVGASTGKRIIQKLEHDHAKHDWATFESSVTIDCSEAEFKTLVEKKLGQWAESAKRAWGKTLWANYR